MVDGGEGVNVWVRFEYFGDRVSLSVAYSACPVKGSKGGSHDVSFISKIVDGFTYSGGHVYFEGKSELYPGDACVAACYVSGTVLIVSGV